LDLATMAAMSPPRISAGLSLPGGAEALTR
jgi:hypothetical protein